MQPQSMQDDGFTQMTGAVPVEHLGADVRGRFIFKTYAHLLGAIMLFTGLEVVYFKTNLAGNILQSVSSMGALLFLGAFILVSYAASHIAHRVRSKPLQYAALIGFVVFESLFFVPLLWFAQDYALKNNTNVIANAAGTTIIGFLGLTMIVFGTRKDFSFLRGIVMWGVFVAIGVILASFFMGFELGTVFFAAMIALAGAAILYDTSNVLHHYPEDRYVAASLELFAGIAMMFWYILRLFISRD